MLDQARQSRLVRRWASSSFAVPALAQAAHSLKNDCNRMHDDTESYMNKASVIHPRTDQELQADRVLLDREPLTKRRNRSKPDIACS